MFMASRVYQAGVFVPVRPQEASKGRDALPGLERHAIYFQAARGQLAPSCPDLAAEVYVAVNVCTC